MSLRSVLSWCNCVVVAGLLAVLAISAGSAQTQFPNGPIRWIIPYLSGGAFEVMARGLAPLLSKEFGVPVVVTVIPGPDGYNQIIKAKPDGQTIGMSEPFGFYATAMLSKPGYNAEDLAWIGRVNASINVIVASKKSGITNVEQFRNRTGTVRAAAFGVTTPILQMIMLADAAKFQLAPVNFRTNGELVIGTIRGDVDIGLLGTTLWLKHIEAGSVTPILIWDTKRDPMFPDVPCLTDIGLAELVVFNNHRGIVVPPKLPKAVQERLEDGFRKVLDGEGKAFLEQAKFETNAMWGREFVDIVATVKQSLSQNEALIRRLMQ